MKYIKNIVDEDDLTAVMSDEMWQMIKAHVAWNNRGGVEEILRELVRTTKEKVKRDWTCDVCKSMDEYHGA